MLRPGVTLIELLISSAIIAMLLIGIVGSVSISSSIRTQTRVALTTQENMRYAMERIASHSTEAVDIFSPTLGETSSTLTLFTSSSSTNPTRITLQQGIVFISYGTSTQSPLTSREIEITRLDFTRVSSTVPGIRLLVNARPLLSATTTIMLRR